MILGSFGAGILEDIGSTIGVTIGRIISAFISVASLVVICWAIFFRALTR